MYVLLTSSVQALCNDDQIWSSFVEETAKSPRDAADEKRLDPLKAEYLDVIVTDIQTRNGLGFSVQILNSVGT
jgi:staphylococcal nuclease domain-containing protein 1